MVSRPLSICIFVAAVTCISIPSFAEQTPYQKSNIEHSSSKDGKTSLANNEQTAIDSNKNAEINAKRWDIKVSDWLRYEELSQGMAKYDYAHLEPAFVLGIFARNAQERERFARIYAKREHVRVQGLLDFDRAFNKASIQLAQENNQSMIDNDLFYKHKPKQKTEQDLYDAVLNPGDRLALFVSTDCAECSDIYQLVYHRRNELNTALDIYFIGNSTDDQIREWARKTGIKPDDVMSGKVTLNHDKGEAKRFGATEVPSIFVRVE